MNIKIKNFGAIVDADVKLDGITVICGDNNTGKSTVGKALFAFYNLLYDLNNKITSIKTSQIRKFLSPYAFSLDERNEYRFRNDEDLEEFPFDGKISVDELKNYIDKHIEFSTGKKVTKKSLIPLADALNVPVSEIVNELALRNFNSVMNGQIKNINNPNKDGSITVAFSQRIDDNQNTISFTESTCNCDKIEVPIHHAAYYIRNPFVLDWLNNLNRTNVLGSMNPMDRNTVRAIVQTQDDINDNPIINVIDSVRYKNELESIRKIIKRAYTGNTVIDNGRYFYIENGKKIDFRNLSGGLKSFALIERMLAIGVLKREDILILDNPETYLHSEWQIIYTELIVALQKYLGLKILITTHSFQFLESIYYYMEKYDIGNKGNCYISVQVENGYKIIDAPDNLTKVRKSLKNGMCKLVDMKLDDIMSSDSKEVN